MASGVWQTSPDDMLLLDRVARALMAAGRAGQRRNVAQFFPRLRAEYPQSRAAHRHATRAGSRTIATAVWPARCCTKPAPRPSSKTRAEAERLAAQLLRHLSERRNRARVGAGARSSGPSDKDAVRALRRRLCHSRSARHRRRSRRRPPEARRALSQNAPHEKGLGDIILAAYDRTSALVEDGAKNDWWRSIRIWPPPIPCNFACPVSTAKR